jgi:hypothetical protein
MEDNANRPVADRQSVSLRQAVHELFCGVHADGKVSPDQIDVDLR